MGKRRVILFRHAKSDWDADFDSDHARPLNRRGRRAAAVMGRVLAAADQVPPQARVSDAVRARTTYELAAEAGAWECEATMRPELYGADPDGVLELLRQTPDDCRSILLVGHEPTFSETASRMVGGGDIRFPTATLARIDFAIDSWNRLDYDRGLLIWLLPPKFFTKGSFEELDPR